MTRLKLTHHEKIILLEVLEFFIGIQDDHFSNKDYITMDKILEKLESELQ